MEKLPSLPKFKVETEVLQFIEWNKGDITEPLNLLLFFVLLDKLKNKK